MDSVVTPHYPKRPSLGPAGGCGAPPAAVTCRQQFATLANVANISLGVWGTPGCPTDLMRWQRIKSPPGICVPRGPFEPAHSARPSLLARRRHPKPGAPAASYWGGTHPRRRRQQFATLANVANISLGVWVAPGCPSGLNVGGPGRAAPPASPSWRALGSVERFWLGPPRRGSPLEPAPLGRRFPPDGLTGAPGSLLTGSQYRFRGGSGRRGML